MANTSKNKKQMHTHKERRSWNHNKHKNRVSKQGEMGLSKKQQAILNAPVSPGDRASVSIHGIGSSGEGVGRINDFTVFVPFALPGEEVEVEITIVKKSYAVGRLISIVKASSQRIKPNCELYGICGGCQLQHITYEGQLELKTQKVKDVIQRIAHLNPNLVKPTLGPEYPWAYRNKMQMPVGRTRDNLKMGFYAMGSHDIVQGTNCPIQDEGNNQIAQACYDIATELGIEPYDEHTGKGILRHVIGRIGQSGWMVILVTATEYLPQQEEWITRITARLPRVETIVHNVNHRRTNVILGATNHILFGDGTIIDHIKDLQFTLSPHSFFQVNPEQTTVLYDQALEYAALQGNETVIDAYCGTGTISLFLAHKAKHVIGIEIVEPAIINARENAKRNGYDNTEFIVADAAVEMPKLYEKGIRPDVIVFDPIRAGCKEEVLTSAAAMEPKRIVYVSCNPATMARDIAVLTELGYELREVQPVDMFPMTAHVETVVLMSRVRD
ncbi:23S rRNA (uracil(1939)-C(5))-methyltransferase RlmD [Exercitatus varius]|uniref:23S rRNA (Uracil(1939)-C(5))-methyltransferase RlmD n=1 Tax=Exercitatus varius TaxID=67857 RepID=A0AAW6Q9E6_9PAST|nr:23S rRNA (uracil(1939)-C(5))-methyltransferase RlmD [Exercitatus varius]MDG2950214.1 23S rRNA (uracil(1939)-C(5))-methyltransferase RlmD [Exercitatus varius]